MNCRKTIRSLVVSLSAILFAAPAAAQAWVYPTFQHPHILRREFNVGVASAGDYGTSLVFQWREGVGVGTELTFDLGVADPKGSSSDARLLIGGALAHRIIQANESVPLDFVLTGGLYGSFGDDVSIFRVPLGATIGHRFLLEGGNAITPYAHPRVTIDFCDNCPGDDSDVGVLFDLGVDAELSRQLALRGAVTFGGLAGDDDSDVGFGISISWKPSGLISR